MPSERYGNAARSKLASTITNSQGTITVTTGEGAKFPVGLFHLSVVDSAGNFEVMWCSSRATDVLTVLRGRQGTSGFAFSSGADVLHGALAHSYQEYDDATIRQMMSA